MPTVQASEVYYDPYDLEINRDPYPTYRRLREEAPLYYNEPHDFYAVSRHEDVAKGLSDRWWHRWSRRPGRSRRRAWTRWWACNGLT